MKKRAKFLTIFLAIAAIGCSAALAACQPTNNESSSSSPEEVDPNFDTATGLNFELSENGQYYIVKSSPNCNRELVIPENFKGIPVREIDDKAFSAVELTSVTMPATIDTIGEEAFYNCTSLQEIVIPDSVNAIGNSAFAFCSNAETLTIGNNVKRIGSQAFAYCSKLETLTIPDSVTVLEDNAFYGCSSLSIVDLGNGVETIEHLAFGYCTSLMRITVGTGLKHISYGAFDMGMQSVTIGDIYINDLAAWCQIDGLQYLMSAKPAKSLFVNNEMVIQLEIPDGVTEIKEYAFHNCADLTWANLPNSVERVGEHAFTKCEQLEGTFKNGLLYFGNVANPYLYLYRAQFTGLTENVVIDNECKIASPHAFDGCNDLVTKEYAGAKYIGNEKNPYVYLVGATSKYVASVTIHGDCKFLAENAFRYCERIESIAIPEHINMIPSRAFQSCIALTSISFASDIYYIGESAFDGCKALTEFTIPEKVTEILPFTFSMCTSLTTVNIHNGVTSIGRCAFQGCPMTNVEIPNSVVYLEEKVFTNCKSLTSITFNGTMAEWENVEKVSALTNTAGVKVICTDGEVSIS